MWLAADSNGSNSLEENEYIALNKKLQIAVLGNYDEVSGLALSKEDWKMDAQGTPAEISLAFLKVAAPPAMIAPLRLQFEMNPSVQTARAKRSSSCFLPREFVCGEGS